MTWKECLEKAVEQLQSVGIEEAKLDAWYLLEHVSGMSRSSFFLHGQEDMPEDVWERYQPLVAYRKQHIPLQHLTGYQEFMGLEFQVGSQVLVPRQDTEELVERLIPLVQGKKVLDMCTGSGCIAISLAHYGHPIQIDGVDLSMEALQIARGNVEKHQVKVGLYRSDLYDAISEQYDIIVSNPPYIASAEIDTLMPEVREHEPMMALDGGEDGLDIYRRLASESAEYLLPGGMIWMEIGYDQGESVPALFADQGYVEIQCIRDLTGKNRIVKACLPR